MARPIVAPIPWQSTVSRRAAASPVGFQRAASLFEQGDFIHPFRQESAERLHLRCSSASLVAAGTDDQGKVLSLRREAEAQVQENVTRRDRCGELDLNFGKLLLLRLGRSGAGE